MGCTGAVNKERLINKANLKTEDIEKLRESAITSSNIESDYTVVKKLKELVSVKYYQVTNKISGKDFCMKVIKRDQKKEEEDTNDLPHQINASL